jgi:hypothetical protein
MPNIIKPEELTANNCKPFAAGCVMAEAAEFKFKISKNY